MSFLPPLLNQKEESWLSQLQEAKFRGIPFAVLSSRSAFGRRSAIHEYPFRDKPYVEDLGRASRRITISGFLVQNSLVYGGGDVITQRDMFVGACEKAGAGTLIHPTLGELTVSVINNGLEFTERWDSGRCIEFRLTVIESGIKVFPITSSSRLDSPTLDFFQNLVLVTTLFIAAIRRAIRKITTTIAQLKKTAEFWIRYISGIADEATNLKNSAKNLFPSDQYGRYNTGRSSKLERGQKQTTSEIMSRKIAETVKSRAEITASQTALMAIETVEQFAEQAKNLMLALLRAINSPDDAIRSLGQLSGLNNICCENGESADINKLTNSYFRQLAAMLAAYISADYQPSSYDDAIEKIAGVSGPLKLEATIAADDGNDELYQLLSKIAISVANDLIAKGSALARIKQFNVELPTPALTLANSLYQDPSRTAELIQVVDPVHPAFMPTRFKGLSR